MPRESYVKPEIKSEILEPEALCGAGSGVGDFQIQRGSFWDFWSSWCGWW